MTDLPPGALAKIGRSQQLTHELLGAFTSWTIANVPADPVRRIAEDRLSWTMYLEEFPEPPLLAWSLIAGDAIHNLRSALDVAVFELGGGMSLPTKTQEQVLFPVVIDPERWEWAKKRRLAGLPSELVERIENVQPFQRTESEREGDPMWVLHQLDIADKHRLPLTTKVGGHHVEHAFQVDFEEAPGLGSDPDITVNVPELEPGALLVEHRTSERIKAVRGQVHLEFRLALDVPVVGLTTVSDFFTHTGRSVRQAVGYLTTGN